MDAFLARMEDPDHWRTLEDPIDQKQVKLTDQEVDMISRMYRGQHADSDFDPYQVNPRCLLVKI